VTASPTAVGASPEPPDAQQRRRITDDLDATLFVEAGAGSGKTTALVERVLGLVTSGRAELRSIAAITFTEKAGAELRDRIRRRLEQAAAGSPDPVVAERCAAAADQLDGSAIGTLHAFAQRILSENPVEAGLPPRVEILDEVSTDVEFDRRWTAFRDQLLADPELERTLLLLFATGVRDVALRILAVEFDRNWDLVDERVDPSAPDPPDVAHLLGGALDRIDAICAQRGGCTDTADKLLERLDEVAAHAERLRSLDDELDLLDELAGNGPTKPPSYRVGNKGKAGSWPDVAALRAEVAEAGEELARITGIVAEACARRIGAAIRGFTLTSADQRRAAGQLAFHDLLVLSRSLLRHPEHGRAVRDRLHGRYRHLLLDEFQDTDPIQVELAVRIAAADPASAEAAEPDWADVPVAPGQLFVVGDPKQSIYRFRRADISTFLRARSRFGPEGGGVVELSANFRTGAPVIEWVNATFGRLMAEAPLVDLPDDVHSQPEYVPLQPTRPAPPTGPAVSVVGRAEVAEASAGELRAAEASEVAATVARAVTEGWSVRDHAGPEGSWRPARLGDVTILVPARTSLPFLEDALDEAGIPFRAESSSLVYASRAVRDLLMVLRAVDDPTDLHRVVAALRTPLFACGDDDLFRFKVERGGRWSYLATQPDTVPEDDPVRLALAYLRGLHHERTWLAPSQLLDRIARDRRSFELGFAEGRPRDVWRRLRYVIDQARGWSDATSGSLRQYLQWVQRQTAEGARVAEAVLPETDDDAVRIMTIHAAKGLEFPITIVSGMSTLPQARPASAQVAFPPKGGVGYRFGKHVTTEEFAEWAPIDEQMGYDERIRLLYVACTRAEDHLVVSLRRKVRAKAPSPDKRTSAELLHDGMGDLLDGLPDAVDEAAEAPRVPPADRPEPPRPFAEWEAELSAALRAGSRPSTVAATALTDEGRPDDDAAAERAAAEGALADGRSPVVDSPLPEPPEGQAQLPFDLPDELAASDDRAAREEARRAARAEEARAVDEQAGLAKRPRDLDLPPWLKGRYGTAMGRAVHGVLQTVDLGSGDALDEAVAAQCEAEAVPAARAPEVAFLARAALGSELVVEAAGLPHWREVYACVPVGDRLLEGYVDLLYRRADGLVVVDYKTSATSDPEELARRVEGYRLQGASYALSVARATGDPVVRVAFLFLTPEGAVVIDLDRVAESVADVERLVEAGAEHVTA
jgi:ATP-dependent helicase/nuclease subunit A